MFHPNKSITRRVPSVPGALRSHGKQRVHPDSLHTPLLGFDLAARRFQPRHRIFRASDSRLLERSALAGPRGSCSSEQTLPSGMASGVPRDGTGPARPAPAPARPLPLSGCSDPAPASPQLSHHSHHFRICFSSWKQIPAKSSPAKPGSSPLRGIGDRQRWFPPPRDGDRVGRTRGHSWPPPPPPASFQGKPRSGQRWE